MQQPINVTPENIDPLIANFTKQLQLLQRKNEARSILVEKLQHPDKPFEIVTALAEFLTSYFDNSVELEACGRALRELEEIKTKMNSNIIIPSINANIPNLGKPTLV